MNPGPIPGFSPERYEAELDEALARIEKYRVGVRVRRAKHVEEAREMDVLNGVFALRYFNRRLSGHVGLHGLVPIDIIQKARRPGAVGLGIDRGQTRAEL